MNTVILTGRLENIEAKPLNNGKTLYKLSVTIQWGSGQYAKTGRVDLTYWGSTRNLSVGQAVVVQAEVNSREYQGKWYSDLVSREVHALAGASRSDSVQDSPPYVPQQHPDEQQAKPASKTPPWVNDAD